MSATERILVIKLGALGDFLLALGPMATVRDHHPAAHRVLLTTRLYAPLVHGSGLFHEVWLDRRPKWWQMAALWDLRRRLRGGRFDRVYDFQNSDRTALYFRLLGPGRRPDWSGRVAGCSHRFVIDRAQIGHASDWQRHQLLQAGLGAPKAPDLSWLGDPATPARFGLSEPYALLVPGCSAHRPEKRWPAEHYAELGNRLAARGVIPVLTGSPAEAALTGAIAARCPAALDLAGRTSLADLVALARAAAGAVGNDTGPIHLIALAGCPTVVVFSAASDPVRNRPLGDHVRVLFSADLAALAVDQVETALVLRAT